MALWKHDNTHETWDDRLTAKPGEDGFTRERAEAHFGDKNFSYMGTPNWAPPPEPEPPGDALRTASTTDSNCTCGSRASRGSRPEYVQ
jgi:hypothetical protein